MIQLIEIKRPPDSGGLFDGGDGGNDSAPIFPMVVILENAPLSRLDTTDFL